MAALCRTEAGELFAQTGNNEVSRVWENPWKIIFRDLQQMDQTESAAPTQVVCAQTADSEAIDLLQYRYPFEKVCNVAGKLTATQLKGRLQDQEAADGAVDLPRRAAAYHFRRPSFMPHALTAAERGTATHLFMQFADYSSCGNRQSLEKELERLVTGEYLTRQQADAVELAQIQRFFGSDLGQWLLQQKLKREFKFSLLVDAGDYGLDAPDEKVLLQGVVDCFVLEDDGLTILDFKTDRAPDPDRYRPQLEAYANALSRIYQKPIKDKMLYFFATGDEIHL